jgi:hypothetical protein
MLIAYNDKMLSYYTMIKLKSPPEYHASESTMWILKSLIESVIVKSGSFNRNQINEHHNNTGNQIEPHKTTVNTTPHLDDEITKKTQKKYN